MRQISRWTIIVAIILCNFLLARQPAGAQVPGTSSPYLFGVINDRGQHDADEWARGVRATTLELHWRLYEPQPGVYDLGYIRAKQERLAQLKAQGWFVQLVPGYQYVPEWVFTQYPNMHYVNQYGERYEPTRNSFRVINAPFNPEARALIAGYIARVFQDFPASNFDSVRVGGSVQGELRYPPQSWNGHNNSYWAFDSHAQNAQESGIPQEVIGWRPGIDPNPGSVERGQLLVNGGFEETHPYLSFLGWAPDDEVLAEAETGSPHSGTQALRLTLSSPHRTHQFVAVQPGQTYRFGGWFRVGGQGRARLFLNQYDAAMQPVASVPYGRLESNALEWSEQAGSLTLSPSTHYLKVELDGSEAGTYYFDDLWLMREGETNLASRDIRVPLAFYDWYVQSLTDYQNWQIAQLRQHYEGQLDLVYPGKGSLPHQITDALTNDLRGNGWSEQSSALYAGTAYDRHVAELASTQNLALYLTGIDEPPASQVNDLSPYPRYWSAARWLGFVASSRGLPIWAENSGQDDVTKMHLSVQRMRDNGFFGLLWAFESELYSQPNTYGYATVDDYTAIIATVNGPSSVPSPTDTPSPTATNTPTATSTPSPTVTNAPSPTAINTPSPSRTATPFVVGLVRNPQGAAWPAPSICASAGASTPSPCRTNMTSGYFSLPTGRSHWGVWMQAAANEVVIGVTPVPGGGTANINGSSAQYVWPRWDTGRKDVRFVVATVTPSPSPSQTPTPGQTPSATPTRTATVPATATSTPFAVGVVRNPQMTPWVVPTICASDGASTPSPCRANMTSGFFSLPAGRSHWGVWMQAAANEVVIGVTPVPGGGTANINGSSAQYVWPRWDTGRKDVRFIIATVTPSSSNGSANGAGTHATTGLTLYLPMVSHATDR